MYVIKKQVAGQPCLDHGRKFGTRDKAIIWMQRDCLQEFAPYYNNGAGFKRDYVGYPDDIAETDCWVVYYESEPEVNEFGMVMP